jgi:hypothetical protein
MKSGITLLTVQVVFLVALQLVSLVVLWAVNPLSQGATDTFALYLSIDLLAFVILSYIYRSGRWGRVSNQFWVALGLLSLTVLLVSNLVLG